MFSCSIMSDSLLPHGLQHTRFPCPSPSPRVCSSSCPLRRWSHSTISFSVTPLLLLLSIFPSIRVFSRESAFCMRWPKYWSFGFRIGPSKDYSGLISFKIDWFDLAVQGTLSRVISSTTVWNHQFFSTQPSLWFWMPPISTFLLGNWPFPLQWKLTFLHSLAGSLFCSITMDWCAHPKQKTISALSNLKFKISGCSYYHK